MSEIITRDSVAPNTLSEAAVDALRLDLSMLSPADEARERFWVSSANMSLAINFGKFMGQPPFSDEDIASRFIFTTPEIMNTFEAQWAHYGSVHEEYLSPERSTGAIFFDSDIGNIVILALPDGWDELDPEVQQSFLGQASGDVKRAQALAYRSILFGQEVHELAHMYQDGGLPLSFLECGAYYYTDAIQSRRGSYYLSELEDQERAAFYASLIAEYGEEVHRVFFGTSLDEEKKHKILNAFTSETVQRLFPDMRVSTALPDFTNK